MRAARSESTHAGSVKIMALRMCDETIKSNIELIKRKHAKKLADKLKEASTEIEKDKLLSIHVSRCDFEIEDYKKVIHNYMNPTPIIITPVPTIIPGLELDFS